MDLVSQIPSADAAPFDQRAVTHAPPSILIVDDDVGTCETFQFELRREGYVVVTAGSGAEALHIASGRAVDLLVVDLRLPDMLGTEVAKVLNANARVPFVLISAFLTTKVTVEAMRLGAANVVEKPVDIEALRRIVSSFFLEHAASRLPMQHGECHGPFVMPPNVRPASTPERWAHYVMKACEAKEDLTSVGRWAMSVGASKTSISETCRLLGIHPREARDLTRLLRALVQSTLHRCPPEALLLVSDGRTLEALFVRGGLSLGIACRSVSLDQFLASQQFVGVDNDGLKALRRLVNQTS
jgi:DNA-binding response OmpR family regulator